MLGENSGKIKKSKKGFTLIEMLVVIFVLGIGLIGALSFFNINLNSQFEAKNELIAAGLAQEGLDLVRNLTDYNAMNLATRGKWYKELANSSNGNSNCKSIDAESLSDHNCETGNASRLTSVCQNSANGRYYQCGNIASANRITTVFTRTVAIQGVNVNGINELPAGVDLDARDCIEVTSTVTWSASSRKTEAKDTICEPR